MPYLQYPIPHNIVKEILSIYDSPLYVYQGDILRQTIAHITKSIVYPHTKFHFASVTNGNLSLLQIFKDCGWGIHANTPGDVYLALKAGFPAENIVYSGSNLSAEEMAQLLKWGITTFNLDSIAQLQTFCDIYQFQNHHNCSGSILLPNVSPSEQDVSITNNKIESAAKEIKLGLRLNLPEITGDSRIGVQSNQFIEAVKIAEKVNLKISGLHFYRGTGTNATKAFTQVINQIIETAKLLPDWQYLDFGGGFGYPYYHDRVAFDWEIFGNEITDILLKLDKKIDLIIEPGRAAIAGCATLLAQVVSVKWQEDKQIIGVNTTVANLSVPSVHGGYREIVSWKSGKLYLTDVCGNTTYSRDYLGKNCQLPKLEIGDMVAILDVGAYGYAMSSHFLHRIRPAEVLLENHNHKLIRKREDYDILLHNQIFS
ncbi:MAG: decarboxylase [Richelia sp. RM2_1_2]|nr:decarboxylase [Richelia sp. SM2_1_7]NJM23184.1 decarboxylase [Richelia sp. SM1_7_0]NJN13041.1 decarboxylase [Richelia sp. RM1_1_1]NJO30726.1 decarboxylase [Richelia sp. SL_2_1]NJO61010.1 decarboxylase [Richelia sp. RM2_1_2]